METNENPQPEEPDSGKEADTEPEKEECMWEVDPLVTINNKLDVDNTANDVGGWYINEKLDLAYFSVFASDSVPSDTSTEVDDDLVGNGCFDIIACTNEVVLRNAPRGW